MLRCIQNANQEVIVVQRCLIGFLAFAPAAPSAFAAGSGKADTAATAELSFFSAQPGVAGNDNRPISLMMEEDL